MTSATDDPRLQLQPVTTRTRGWLLALTVLLPLAITGMALVVETRSDGPKDLIADSMPLTVMLVIALVAASTLAIWWVLDRALRRHRLDLDRSGLTLITTFYRQHLTWHELRIDQARVIDLTERTELKPMFKTNGAALPGLQSGWFRLRNRSKALVARTGGARVLWLPTTRGFDLLLQPRQPQALLQHLQELAPPAVPR